MSEAPPVQAIVLADVEGLIRYWSPGAEALFGHAAAEVEGRSLDLIVPEEYRERHWTGFRRAMQSGECSIDGAATNIPVTCQDGAVRVFPARFVFLQDAHARVVGAMAIYSAPAGSEQAFGPVVTG